MDIEEKIDKSIIEIDLNKKEIKGYCKVKNFKEQFQKLKEMTQSNK